jgi:hypothetical protein
MHTSLFGNRPAWIKALLLGTALVLSAAMFIACETGSDDSETPLPGVRIFQVTAKNESLVLMFTKVSPAQGIAPSYEVWYGTSASSSAAALWDTLPTNSSQLITTTITGLTNHQTYYIWIKTVYAGLGASKLEGPEYNAPIPPPLTPGTLTVTPGEQMLEIQWAAVEDAATYEVYYKANGSGTTPPTDAGLTTVSVTGAVISGLTNGTSYKVWVRAQNTAGDSPGYSVDTGTPAEAGSEPTVAPLIKTPVVPGNNKLTLTWDQVPGVPSYKLYYSTANNSAAATAFPGTVPADAPTVSADITGLINGTLYYVWVKSSNSQGDSAASTSATGTPQGKPAIAFSNLKFELGKAAAEFIFAGTLPVSIFWTPTDQHDWDRITRAYETASGDLFTDAADWYVKTKLGKSIDFVFLNGGYVDNAIPKGTITVGGIQGIVDPDSRLQKIVIVTLSGTQLKKFFNDATGKLTNVEPGDVSGVAHSGRGGPPNTKFFGMVSKEVRYTLTYYTPPAPHAGGEWYAGFDEAAFDSEPYMHGFINTGSSANQYGDPLKINGATIVDGNTYRICTTDSLATGAYFVTLGEGTKEVIDTPFWHAIAEYIYDQGNVTPKLDGRIKIVGGVNLPPPWVPGNLTP